MISNFSEYEVCDPKYFTAQVCSQYPFWQPCGCPLRAGGYALRDVQVALPDIGVLKSVVAVSIFAVYIIKQVIRVNQSFVIMPTLSLGHLIK